MEAPLRLIADDGDGPACGRGTRRGQGGREDVRPGVVDEPLHQPPRAANEAALGTKGFTQRADLDEPIGVERRGRQQVRHAAAGVAENAGGVRLVEDQHAVMAAGQLRQFGERGQVAVHAEN